MYKHCIMILQNFLVCLQPTSIVHALQTTRLPKFFLLCSQLIEKYGEPMPAKFAAFFMEIKSTIAGKNNKTGSYQESIWVNIPHTSLDNSQEW